MLRRGIVTKLSLLSSSFSNINYNNKRSSHTYDYQFNKEKLTKLQQLLEKVPDAPNYSFSESSNVFDVERYGEVHKDWILDYFKLQLHSSSNENNNSKRKSYSNPVAMSLFPSQTEFMKSSIVDALRLIALTLPYSTILQIIMEHHYFFLFFNEFDVILHKKDAPLPHIVYEDICQCLTFSSFQDEVEKQFYIPHRILKILLANCGYYCSRDRHYFHSCKVLFYDKMDKQQNILQRGGSSTDGARSSAEVVSAFIYVCTAADEVSEAVSLLFYFFRKDERNQSQNLMFDSEVFSWMMNPSVLPSSIVTKKNTKIETTNIYSGSQNDANMNAMNSMESSSFYYPDRVKRGLLLQQRLCRNMHENFHYSIDNNNNNNNSGEEEGESYRYVEGNNTIAVGVHAMFSYYLLTNKKTEKWKLLEEVIERFMKDNRNSHRVLNYDEVITKRTRRLLLEAFAKEKGLYCTPRQIKFLLFYLCNIQFSDKNMNADANASYGEILYVIMRQRMNEEILLHSSNVNSDESKKKLAQLNLPFSSFELEREEEEVFINNMKHRIHNSKHVNNNNNNRMKIAAPLVESLLLNPQNHDNSNNNNNNSIAESNKNNNNNNNSYDDALKSINTITSLIKTRQNELLNNNNKDKDKDDSNWSDNTMVSSNNEMSDEEQLYEALEEITNDISYLDGINNNNNNNNNRHSNDGIVMVSNARGNSNAMNWYSALEAEKERKNNKYKEYSQTAWISPYYRDE